MQADSNQIEPVKRRRRISRKQLTRLEAMCRSAAALMGAQITLIDRNGQIVFRAGSTLSSQGQEAMRALRSWFFRQLRKKNGSMRPPAPGPVIFTAESDRFWAALSLKPEVWSRELLLIGPVTAEQTEGALQQLTDLLSQGFHEKPAVISSWLEDGKLVAIPRIVKVLRNSRRPELPVQDIQNQYLLALKLGDLSKIEQIKSLFANKWLDMSARPLRLQKNEALLIAQQATTAASESALDIEIAEGIMDDYLRTIETCRTPEEVLSWLNNLFRELTEQISAHLQDAWSQPVRLCQHYIARRIYSKITLDDLSRYTGHNPSYLSRHFKSETGESLTRYIMKKKIEAACELLREYKKPIQDVAIMLAYSDQAHFTRSFRQVTGTTPLKYFNSSQIEIDNPEES